MWQSFTETIFSKLPILFLGAALMLLFFVTVPPPNHDELISIVSGFLGLLTGRALGQSRGSGDATPPTPPDAGPTP